MTIRPEQIKVGTRVAYEDMANPRREGRVAEIIPSGQYRVVWDGEHAGMCCNHECPRFEYRESVGFDPERARCDVCGQLLVHESGVAWRDAQPPVETFSDLRQPGWTIVAESKTRSARGRDYVTDDEGRPHDVYSGEPLEL